MAYAKCILIHTRRYEPVRTTNEHSYISELRRRLAHYEGRPDVQAANLAFGHSSRLRAKGQLARTPSHFTCLLTSAKYTV